MINNTPFFNKTFEETVELLHSTKQYISSSKTASDNSPMQKLAYCQETMRLTTQLTHIMSWLLMQKAIHAGEITLEEFIKKDRALQDESICFKSNKEHKLPLELRMLLEKSQHLFTRVSRLDQMMRQNKEKGDTDKASS